ncbi:hypothetical protein KC726_05215 [Candidatus Woesebacteria bacterium]|nr:hypothetical protein [Candidatus Woesebacteria bacterium]
MDIKNGPPSTDIDAALTFDKNQFLAIFPQPNINGEMWGVRGICEPDKEVRHPDWSYLTPEKHVVNKLSFWLSQLLATKVHQTVKDEDAQIKTTITGYFDEAREYFGQCGINWNDFLRAQQDDILLKTFAQNGYMSWMFQRYNSEQQAQKNAQVQALLREKRWQPLLQKLAEKMEISMWRSLDPQAFGTMVDETFESLLQENE